MWRLSSQDLICHQELFYVWEIPFTLVFTCLFPRYLRSWPQVCLSLRSTCKVSQKCRRKCHRSIREKGTGTKAKSLFVGSLEISSKKSSHWKMPRIFATKRLGRYPGRGYSFTLAIRVCNSVAPKSTVFQSNLYYKTMIWFSPSCRKNIQHFQLISLRDLTLHTETNDDHWKLKEKHPR